MSAAAARGPLESLTCAGRVAHTTGAVTCGVRGHGGPTVIVRVRHCPEADRDHRRARRQYAHTAHMPGVVCVARAFWQLPVGHQRGLLLHELGHLALVRRRHSEADADREARRRYGIRITYRSSARWGQRLEYA